jgi:23S rRNA pseudouridine1911/1915/1917 synthase
MLHHAERDDYNVTMAIRTIVVSREESGLQVAGLLKLHLRLSWSQARRMIEQKRVMQGPRLCRDPYGRARAGQKLRIQIDDKPTAPTTKSQTNKKPSSVGRISNPSHKKAISPGSVGRIGNPSNNTKSQLGKEPPSNAADGRIVNPSYKIKLVYADDQIVVVDKPAGLTTMRHAHEAAEFGKRGQRYLPTTLADILPELLESQGKGRGRVIAVHRLDRDTSGLVIFARNQTAARHLGAQFRGHTSGRTYLAVVRGRAKAERIESSHVADRGDGRRGSRPADGQETGQRAITHVKVVEPLGDFTLVECRLETGRTHQVRIHLGERGTPICGEHIYDRPLHGKPLPDGSGAKRLALHAASLAVDHPRAGKRLEWSAPLPAEMEELVKKLRRKK